MNQMESLEAINSIADQYIKDTPRDLKLDVLTPRGVNLKVEQTEDGKWIDPCEDTKKGCVDDRPAVVYFPTDGETIGALPIIAVTVGAPLLLCESDKVKCFEAANKNSSKVVVVGSGSVLKFHQEIVQKKEKVPSAYWLLSPVMNSVNPKPWYADQNDVLLPKLSESEVSALPPMYVSTSSSTTSETEEYLKKISPTSTFDIRSSLPHNFIVFSDWLPEFSLTAFEARKFFDSSL